jgi:hypothetical protein
LPVKLAGGSRSAGGGGGEELAAGVQGPGEAADAPLRVELQYGREGLGGGGGGAGQELSPGELDPGEGLAAVGPGAGRQSLIEADGGLRGVSKRDRVMMVGALPTHLSPKIAISDGCGSSEGTG